VGEGRHIEGASWWPLNNFKVAPPEIDRDVPMAVHCKVRYRSMIACSLLQWAVFPNVVNVIGDSKRGRKPNFLWLREAGWGLMWSLRVRNPWQLDCGGGIACDLPSNHRAPSEILLKVAQTSDPWMVHPFDGV